MGKGLIISGGTGGLYNVKLILDRTFINTEIPKLEAQITAYETKIAGMAEGVAKEKAKLYKNSLIKRKEYYENSMPDDPIITAWCADYTEDLSGIVGTIDVPGERGYVNIQPGYDGNAAYDEDRDGQLQPAIASASAAAVFYNLAMLPAWQKWQPTYRYGTIRSINRITEKCTVELEAIPSSQQDLNINFLDKLENVDISYMMYGHKVFNIGDRVIIKFTSDRAKTEENWATGTVIGFVDNPRSFTFHFRLTRGDGTLITEASGLFRVIYMFNSNNEELNLYEDPTYNAETEEWSVTIDYENNIYDSDGYWADYMCEDCAYTQYPYRYKADDEDKEADLIHCGHYEDTLPFWKIVTVITGDIEQIGSILKKTYTVYSSIPYKLTYYVEGVADRKPHIRYWSENFIPSGLNDAGDRCCDQSFQGYVADINPIDSELDDEIYYNDPPDNWVVHGGWGDSLLEITVESVAIGFIEIFPAVASVSLEDTNYSGPSVGGAEYSIQMTNTTTPHGSREMTCYGPPCTFPSVCDYTGSENLTYDKTLLGDPGSPDDHLKIGIKDFEYDF